MGKLPGKRWMLLKLTIKDLIRWTENCCLTLIEKFNGGPVGVESLAAAIGEEKTTIEDVYEPYLIQEGYLQRTARGRIASAKAYEHFGLKATAGREKSLF